MSVVSMKELPILFSAPMVRAILAGTKTQTRRAVKLPHENRLGVWEPTRFGGPTGGRTAFGKTIPEQGGIWHTRTGDHLACPYGQPGDRLWMREAWLDLQGTGIERVTGDPIRYAYAADTPPGSHGDKCRKNYGLKWRPSIHMPRAASRITLEVTSVRVERLQDISIADSMAEGVLETSPRLADLEPCMEWRYAYEDLWKQINGTGSWDANPWVWVVEFKRVEGEAA